MEPMTVLFDEDCGLCNWSADKLKHLDQQGALSYVGIRSPEGARILANMDPEERLASWHIASDNGAVWSAGAAVPVLARRLRGGRLIAVITELFPETTERAYRWVASHRVQMGRVLGEQACSLAPSAQG